MKKFKLFITVITFVLLLSNPILLVFAAETTAPTETPTTETAPLPTAPQTVTNPETVTAGQNNSQNTNQGTDQNLDQGVGQNVQIGNSETGSDSDNDASLNSDNNQSNDTSNDADVDNNINTSADTGNNNASDNTGNGVINTGDSGQSLNLLNIINSSFVSQNGEISLMLKDVDGDAKGDYIFDPKTFQAFTLSGVPLGPVFNSETGSGSDNDASLDANNNVIVNGSNDATLRNAVDINGNTGNNTASDNTGDGSITTGDASIAVNMFNFLNSSIFAKNGGAFGLLNIFGDWAGNLLVPKNMLGSLDGQGGVSLANTSTGSGSTNSALGAIENLLDVDNDNVAEIDNDLNVSANTGYNIANDNTLGGSVASGDINSKINVTNEGNQNLFGDTVLFTVINVFGKWVGSNLIAPLLSKISSAPFITIVNSKTGSDSSNDASANLDNSQVFTNLNDASINNILNIFGNTGNNTASDNTGSGTVRTGDVKVLTNVMNFANLSVVANKFVFLGINIFGDWLGNIDVAKDKPDPKKVKAIPIMISGTKDVSGGNFDITQIGKNTLLAYEETTESMLIKGPSGTTETETGASSISENNVKTLSDTYSAAKNASNPIVSFISKNLNTILVALLMVYLSFLSVYFRRKRVRDK